MDAGFPPIENDRRMTSMFPRRLLAAVPWALFTGLASCGDRPAGRPAQVADLGPPRWMATHEDVGPGTKAMAVVAGGPCRLTVHFEGGDPLQTTVSIRDLVAGESVRFTWSSRTDGSDGVPAAPPAAEAAEGRTEAMTPVIWFGFSGEPVMQRYPLIWTRPGKGRILPAVDAVPPGSPQEIPFGTDLEVVAVAVVDVAEGEARFVRVDGSGRVRLPKPSPGDRSRVLRLMLRFDRP